MAKTQMTDTTHQSSRSWRSDLRAPIVMALAALLAIQLLVAVGLSLSGGRTMAPSDAEATLFSFTPEQVRGIRVSSGDGAETLLLTRRDNAWVIAELADLPVQTPKVEQLLGDLAALRKPMPIATTEEARKRFKVADDAFERRLVIEGEGGPIADLLVGDSPGFRRVFARPPEDPGVYDLRIALSDVSPQRDDWIEPGILSLELDQITRIAAKDWILIKGEDGTWTLENNDQALDQETVSALVMRVANLGYRGVLGIEDDPAYNQQDPQLELTVGLADGSTRSYRVSKGTDSEDYVLKQADRPWYFKLAEFDLGELMSSDAASFLPVTDVGTIDVEATDRLAPPLPIDEPADMPAAPNGQIAPETSTDTPPEMSPEMSPDASPDTSMTPLNPAEAQAVDEPEMPADIKPAEQADSTAATSSQSEPASRVEPNAPISSDAVLESIEPVGTDESEALR